MRSTTLLAHIMRACILAVALLALPQLASAQLPLETKSLKIQASTGTNAVTMTASTVTAPYTLNFPAAQGTNGGFLYLKTSTDGGLAWTNTPDAQKTTIFWDNTAGEIKWVDPNDANNPNWSRTGNAVGGILGTTAAGQGIDFVTGAAANIRMSIASTGEVNIGTNATHGADVTIGNGNNDIKMDGTVDINGATTIDGATIALAGATSTTINAAAGATNINTGANAAAVGIGNATTATLDLKAVATTIAGTTVGITAATTQTGSLTLAGTASPLVANTGAGATGDVLVSTGATTTPQWKNLSDAIGIRRAGRVALAGVNKTATAISVPNLEATDAIIVTIDQTGDGTSSIVATVTNRTDGPTGNFHVTLSGTYTGNVNYMVIKEKTTD